MSITATIAVTVDLTGDGWTTSPPDGVGTPVINTNSPGELTIYQVALGNNALLLPLNLQVDYLFIDPVAANNGMVLTLKGNVSDTGVQISSINPSLIPVSNVTPNNISNISSWGSTTAVQQVYLQSSQAGQLNTGWL